MVLFYFRIPHYEQRLKALVYKKSFNDRMAELKPQIQGIILTVFKDLSNFCIFPELNKLPNGVSSMFFVTAGSNLSVYQNSKSQTVICCKYLYDSIVPHIGNNFSISDLTQFS